VSAVVPQAATCTLAAFVAASGESVWICAREISIPCTQRGHNAAAASCRPQLTSRHRQTSQTDRQTDRQTDGRTDTDWCFTAFR